MSSDKWFRNETWNDEIEIAFQARLKRPRGVFYVAQYLRIQAGYLLDSDDSTVQLAGVRLMEQLIKDCPTEISQVIFGHEQLGDYYYKQGDLKKAQDYFTNVKSHYNSTNSRSGTSGMADLKFAETILKSNQIEKLDEAYQICKKYPYKEIFFNNDKFYFHELFALICNELGLKKEAQHHSKVALDLSIIKESQLTRHKGIGIIEASSNQLEKLEMILTD